MSSPSTSPSSSTSPGSGTPSGTPSNGPIRLPRLSLAVCAAGLALMAVEPLRSNAVDSENFGFKDGISQPTPKWKTPEPTGAQWDDRVENGEILERGTHSTLFAQQGRYWELYTRQHGLEANLFLAPGEGDTAQEETAAEPKRERDGLASAIQLLRG